MRVLVAVALSLLLAAPAWAAATDSSVRVFGSAPPMTLLMAVLADDKLIAANAPLKNGANNADPRYLPPQVRSLPILGGWHGNQQANLEEILKARPELIVAWDTPLLHDQMERDLQKLNTPVLRLNIDRTADYPQVFRTLGATLGSRTWRNPCSICRGRVGSIGTVCGDHPGAGTREGLMRGKQGWATNRLRPLLPRRTPGPGRRAQYSCVYAKLNHGVDGRQFRAIAAGPTRGDHCARTDSA